MNQNAFTPLSFFLFLLNTLFVIVSKNTDLIIKLYSLFRMAENKQTNKKQQPRTENYMSIYANV